VEPTNPSFLRQHAAQPVLPLGFGLASAVPISARVGLVPAPGAPRQLKLGQLPAHPRPVIAPRRLPARVRVIRPASRPESAMQLVPGTPDDLDVVLGLIEDARGWLRAKGKDQWAKPWPSEQERDARVLKGLENKKTWIVRQGATPVATVTIANWHNPRVWVSGDCTCDLITERAVYLHRLITARAYAGHGLGEWLIEWAAERARAKYGAKWTRIDVWTTNTELHDYYQKLGFEPCGSCPDPQYPSGALFQKPIADPGRSTLLAR
jgi:GNAT superfamily N-acetyltransferase